MFFKKRRICTNYKLPHGSSALAFFQALAFKSGKRKKLPRDVFGLQASSVYAVSLVHRVNVSVIYDVKHEASKTLKLFFNDIPDANKGIIS